MTGTLPDVLPAGPIRAVIIDLDGTMVDTAGDFHAAINAMLEALGATPDMPIDEVVSYVGKGSENLVRRVLDARLPPAQANSRFAEALDAYQRAYIAINGQYANVYDGVREGLAALRDMGLALACVTNKPHDFTRPLLAQLGLDAYFDLVYPGDAFPYRKPDPYPMLRVAEAFGVIPAEVVAIGDSENDARAARAAGMRVLAVPYGYNHGQPIQHAGADAIVDTLFAAAQLIQPYAEPHNAFSAASN
ncbi:phosphoglycolate phosphatase [Ralstonia flaminis]|jgi:phosphoglycolate phosphatase|uniref:Phosphoglycolate phosphatase n=1 Tax=Ralstonia flaminis TaxID=3058597 RepID=A0ABM9KBL1_9RALS|nr:phosphoglycolate phosphatase [Ralstonia sp. LMG 18101]CAJ0820364.1 Phosphoglycolate phosphatase, chromosomal [Ralstonia sp. LMG 18101]